MAGVYEEKGKRGGDNHIANDIGIEFQREGGDRILHPPSHTHRTSKAQSQ